MLVLQAEAPKPKPALKRVPLVKVVRKLAETDSTAPPPKRQMPPATVAADSSAAAAVADGSDGDSGGLAALMGGYGSDSDA